MLIATKKFFYKIFKRGMINMKITPIQERIIDYEITQKEIEIIADNAYKIFTECRKSGLSREEAGRRSIDYLFLERKCFKAKKNGQ